MEKVSFFMGLKFNTEFTYLLLGSLRFSVRIMDCILLSVNTYTRWVNKFLQLIVWFPETIKFGLFNIPIYSFQTINWRNLFTPLSPLNARTPELDGKDALIRKWKSRLTVYGMNPNPIKQFTSYETFFTDRLGVRTALPLFRTITWQHSFLFFLNLQIKLKKRWPSRPDMNHSRTGNSAFKRSVFTHCATQTS